MSCRSWWRSSQELSCITAFTPTRRIVLYPFENVFLMTPDVARMYHGGSRVALPNILPDVSCPIRQTSICKHLDGGFGTSGKHLEGSGKHLQGYATIRLVVVKVVTIVDHTMSELLMMRLIGKPLDKHLAYCKKNTESHLASWALSFLTCESTDM